MSSMIQQGPGFYCDSVFIGELLSISQSIEPISFDGYRDFVRSTLSPELTASLRTEGDGYNTISGRFGGMESHKFSFIMEDMIMEMEAYLSSITKNITYDSYHTVDIILKISGKAFLNYNTNVQDINEMSIYEIMEHVHKRLLIDKAKGDLIE